MELGSIIGLIAGAIFMLLSMLISADFSMSNVVKAFVDYPSIMIVFGGTLAGVLIAYPLKQVLNSFKAGKNILNPLKTDSRAAIKDIIELANFARREGILALEERANSMDDMFLQKGIMLIIDGTDPELVRSILETEMSCIESRHNNTRNVWAFMAASAPAWGMMGTFIGLILMLLDMSDPDLLGPKMSDALITSFYGSFFANYICSPVANKLKCFHEEEMMLKEILIEGILSIQAGENPRIIEEKLKSFLAPSFRSNFLSESGDR